MQYRGVEVINIVQKTPVVHLKRFGMSGEDL